MNLGKYLFGIVALFVLPLILLSPRAEAHPFRYGAINTNLSIRDNKIDLRTSVPQKIIFYNKKPEYKKQAQQYFAENLQISYDFQSCNFILNSTAFTSNQTFFTGTYVCKKVIANFKNLEIQSYLFNQYFANIDHFVTVDLSNQQINLIFNQDKTNYPKNVTPIPKTQLGKFFSVSKQFIWLGIKHIWTGYDHILFLISIVLLIRSIKKIVVLASFFTIAHSITLILAGLHIITISPLIVEPLIALTIFYTAMRNSQLLYNKLWKVNITERELTTSGFGLIHGLGFAGALLAVDVPSGYLVPSLLFFNIGVEIGQLCILLILVPILFYIYKQSYKREVLFALSIATATLALFWFILRIIVNI